MFNPLKKLGTLLGITGVQGRDIEFDPDWSPRGTASGSKSPLHMRVATRRRKNKAARIARRHN